VSIKSLSQIRQLLHLRTEKQASQADCQSSEHGVVELAIHLEKKRALQALKLLGMKEAAEIACVGHSLYCDILISCIGGVSS